SQSTPVVSGKLNCGGSSENSATGGAITITSGSSFSANVIELKGSPSQLYSMPAELSSEPSMYPVVVSSYSETSSSRAPPTETRFTVWLTPSTTANSILSWSGR